MVGLNFSNLSAQVICSAGGKVGAKANFTPDPITNCPQLRDPLASRPPPAVGGCNQRNMVISGGSTTLRRASIAVASGSPRERMCASHR